MLKLTAILCLLGAPLAVSVPAWAANQFDSSDFCTKMQQQDPDLAAQSGCGEQRTALNVVNDIINLALGLIGLVAVVMIIAGGFQLATSAGDAAKVTKAKNTIVYSVVGLVIALLAYAIVNFVISAISS